MINESVNNDNNNKKKKTIFSKIYTNKINRITYITFGEKY